MPKDRLDSRRTGVESAPVGETREWVPLEERRNVRLARPGLAEDYDTPITSREEWWRTAIRETPKPGAYESQHFLRDLEARPNTYRFKSDGRKIDAERFFRKGAALLPGAYERTGIIDDLDKTFTTYSFKNTGRDQRDSLNFGKKDKDINVSPDAYSVEKFLCVNAEPQPSKHSMFKSQIKRFPTLGFVPKKGPAPCAYENIPPPRNKTAVSSSFKSQTPRFKTSHTKYPGPGQYTPVIQYPLPKTIAKMGRHHGIFFSSAFS